MDLLYFHVDWSRDQPHGIAFMGGPIRDKELLEIIHWLQDNFGMDNCRWSIIRNSVRFKYSEDAMLFKLVWHN